MSETHRHEATGSILLGFGVMLAVVDLGLLIGLPALLWWGSGRDAARSWLHDLFTAPAMTILVGGIGLLALVLIASGLAALVSRR